MGIKKYWLQRACGNNGCKGQCAYYAQRQRLKNNLNLDYELNFDLLTSGTENCNTEQNKDIILAVLRYIKIPKDFNKFRQDDFNNVSDCF